jgi:hypothetical protein
MKKTKRIKKDTFDYSPIALRALKRHKYAPPAFSFKDHKKEKSRSQCRVKG